MSKLVVISGPSGVGKGTIVDLLRKKYADEGKKLYLSISCTTRLPREGEVDGVNYYFIKEKEFKKRISEDDFFEYNEYKTGKFYGTPKSTVIEYLNKGYDVILEIDINGYRIIKEKYPDCLGIFIMPPDEEALYERLRNRGTETEDVIETRISAAKEEIAGNSIYDYIIVNETGKVEEAASKIYKLINHENKEWIMNDIF